MQFKHPEILYFLALLIIPILVHLFQLQKFTKVPFTNVAFLQKLALQTRKSSKLKKWLILTTRLLLLSAIIFAFAQPYFSSKEVHQKQENFIYLDNSLSTNAKGEKGVLLKVAIQEVIENISNKDHFSLLTNSNYQTNLSSSELKKALLNTKSTAKELAIKDILLRIENQQKNKTNNTSYKSILISDFQNTYTNDFLNVKGEISLIKKEISLKNNLSIDSVFINDSNNSNFTLNIIVKNQGNSKENVPIAIFDKDKLISKQAFTIEKDKTKNITFSIQESFDFLGKIQLTSNDAFSFDNSFYFSLNSEKKINILSIGKASDFLTKIYTEKEFNHTKSTTQNVNYNAIKRQQLIILNEIEEIPQSLISSLVDFSKNGGHLVIIPSLNANITSYNTFLKSLSAGSISPKTKGDLKITNINFNHPLLKNVFDKKVQNFQYPTSKNYFPSSLKSTSTIISFENNDSFIQQVNLIGSKLYWVAAPLDKSNSNFTNSPLIVPIFYNFAQRSLQHAKLYYSISEENKIEIDTQLGRDAVLTIKNKQSSFIPLQQTHQNKVILSTKNNPLISGFYSIEKQDTSLKTIAYNYAKEESSLQFLDTYELSKLNKNITVSTSIKEVIQEINKKNEVHWLWKWFLALAIVSLLLEIFILKFFKS